MRPSLLMILRCPRCASSLSCQADARDEERILVGTLRCPRCEASYPIVAGIPRFVPRDNYAASFGHQWQRFRATQLDRFNGTQLSERRLISETDRQAPWWRGKRVLDVGCGAGRFMDVAARLGADVVGIDASDAVDAAFENLRSERDFDVVQGDIYALPFAHGAFDLVYCIGVIQHTPAPLRAVAALPQAARPGGGIAVTAYERRRLTPLFGKYLLRALLRRVRMSGRMRLVSGLMPLMFPLTDILFRIPVIGRLFRFILPVANYVDLRELTRAQRYEWALLDTIDMLAPRYDSPQREHDIVQVMRENGVDDIRRLRNPGLNLVGRRSRA